MDKDYMVRKRLRELGREGQRVNIPYGTVLRCADHLIYWNGQVLCSDDCQMQKDYLIIADLTDPKGRAKLVDTIIQLLGIPIECGKVEDLRQERWNRLWSSEWANTFRRQDFSDYWLWTNKFYNAEYEDLKKLYDIIMKGEKQ